MHPPRPYLLALTNSLEPNTLSDRGSASWQGGRFALQGEEGAEPHNPAAVGRGERRAPRWQLPRTPAGEMGIEKSILDKNSFIVNQLILRWQSRDDDGEKRAQ